MIATRNERCVKCLGDIQEHYRPWLLHQGKVCNDLLRMKFAITYLTAWQIGSLLWPNATLHGHAKPAGEDSSQDLVVRVK
jgi:hypothetical protein